MQARHLYLIRHFNEFLMSFPRKRNLELAALCRDPRQRGDDSNNEANNPTKASQAIGMIRAISKRALTGLEIHQQNNSCQPQQYGSDASDTTPPGRYFFDQHEDGNRCHAQKIHDATHEQQQH